MGQKLSLRTGRIFHRASPYEVSSFVKSHIGNHAIELRRHSSRATLNYKSFGALGLSQVAYGEYAVVSSSSGLEQDYHFQLVIQGTCRVRYSESDVFMLTPGAGTMINPLRPVSLEYSDDCVKLIVKMPTSLLNLCCISQSGQIPSGGLNFNTDAFQLEEDSPFSKLIELLCEEANQQDLNNHPVASAMGLLVATKLMEVLPHNLCATIDASADTAFFVRVNSFIDSRAHLGAISAEDLARLSNVSVRTLYDRFKVTKGVTPQAYIKARRLQRIYDRIHTATNCVRSVTEVAMEYGFSHLGRFSSEYKLLFGELPSEALRRASLTSKT